MANPNATLSGSLEAQTRMKGTRIEKPMWDRGQDRDDD